ncbi:prophage side tail fiber protein homolog StfR-like [Procambarus clarkii]|uniref:prophage side tail fiber protein homolog StfR-like n=1 Tax=Procambarus clarkii TaxID=6728 RepID=UPI0037430D61
MYSEPNDGASHEAADPRYNDPQQGVLQKNPTWAGPKPRQDGHTKQQPPQHGATAYHHARRPEQAQKAGEHTPAHRGASTTDAEASAADEPLDEATFADEKGVDAESEGREEDSHPTTPASPGSRQSSAGEAGTTPTAAAEDRTEASGCRCTSATTERGTPEAGAPAPTEHTGEADVLCPDQTGTEGALAEPAAGTTPGTSPGREGDEKAPRVSKGGKSPSKKTEGASARGASQLAATWPSAPHRKQMRVWP